MRKNVSLNRRRECCGASSTRFWQDSSIAGRTDAPAARASRIPDRSGKAGAVICLRPFYQCWAGPLGGGGLTVLRAANASEAREIAEAEPFARNCLRTFEIKEWTIMEGTLGLRVTLYLASSTTTRRVRVVSFCTKIFVA